MKRIALTLALMTMIPACASEAEQPEATEQTTQDINGSLALAQAESIREAYLAATGSTITPLALENAPEKVQGSVHSDVGLLANGILVTTAVFTVGNMGPIYLAEMHQRRTDPNGFSTRDIFVHFYDAEGVEKVHMSHFDGSEPFFQANVGNAGYTIPRPSSPTH